MWLIKYRRDGEKPKYITYKTDKGKDNKMKELNDDPLVISISLFKEVTYGEQLGLFEPEKLHY